MDMRKRTLIINFLWLALSFNLSAQLDNDKKFERGVKLMKNMRMTNSQTTPKSSFCYKSRDQAKSQESKLGQDDQKIQANQNF